MASNEADLRAQAEQLARGRTCTDADFVICEEDGALCPGCARFADQLDAFGAAQRAAALRELAAQADTEVIRDWVLFHLTHPAVGRTPE